MSRTLSIIRDQKQERQTLGQFFVLSEFAEILFQGYTLELPWRENQNNISCIPPGRYDVVERYSKKFKRHLHLLDVPNRSLILVHAGNYFTDIEGCILVGKSLKDINRDGLHDVSDSGETMAELMKLDITKLIISWD